MRRVLQLVVILAVTLGVVAPAYAGDGNGAIGSATTASPNGDSGGVGSSIFWWDIKGTATPSILWPSDYTLSWQMGYWANNPTFKQTATEKIASTIQGLNPKLFWTNVCATPGAKSALNGTACASSTIPAGQLHSGSPAGTGDGSRGHIVAWNVQVFESQTVQPTLTDANGGHSTDHLSQAAKKRDASSLIWARQVGITGKSDGAGTDSRDWWTGNNGQGLYATAQARLAGPLSASAFAKSPECRQRYDAAVQKIADVRSGKGTYTKDTSYTNASSLAAYGSSTCYWTLTPGRAPEAEVSLLVTIDQLKDGGQRPTFKLAGKINTSYCIVASALDAREQLGSQPDPKSLPGAIAVGKSFVHCFVPKVTFPHTCKINGKLYTHGQDTLPNGWTWGAKQDDGNYVCNPPPTECKLQDGTVYTYPQSLPGGYSWKRNADGTAWSCPPNVDPSPPVQPTVSLHADATVPSRVWALSTIEVGVPNGLPVDQSVIPDVAMLKFFSPQTAYNGSTGAPAYGLDYARFDSDAGHHPRLQFGGPTGFAQMNLLAQPAQLTPGATNADLTLASNDFRISWLHPTIEAPCSQAEYDALAWNPFLDSIVWPASPATCKGPQNGTLGNAWDDSEVASVNYEQRWLASGSPQDLGWIADQPLRCADTGATTVHVGKDCGGPTASNPRPTKMGLTDFASGNAGYLATGVNATRTAEGYVYAQSGKPDGKAAVAFELKTSANLRDSIAAGTRSVWNRTSPSGETIDTSKGPLFNPITGNAMMVFATPGMPAGAHLATDKTSSAISGDPTVTPAQLGDQQIASGYALGWSWATPSTDWQNTSDGCGFSGKPTTNDFHPPSVDPATAGLNGVKDAAISMANTVGLYSAYGPTPIFPGNPNWSSVLQSYDPILQRTIATVPYTGVRPSAATSPNCNKVIPAADHALSDTTGSWQHTRDDLIPSTKTVTTTTKVCTKKNKKGVCTTWKSVTTTTTVPTTITVRVFTFVADDTSWAPTNQTAANISHRALNTSARAQLQAAYDDGVFNFRSTPTTMIDSSGGLGEAGWVGKTFTGDVVHGSWNTTTQAKPGFGLGQTGPPLDSGYGYMASWQLKNITTAAMQDPNTFWTLGGSYEGFNWDWLSAEKTSVPTTDATAAATVYATRDAG